VVPTAPQLSPKGDTPTREKETPGEEQLAANSKRQRRRDATAHGRWRRVGGDRESGRSGERAAGRKRKGQSAERKASLAKGLGAMRHALGANGHWATGGFVEKSNR